MNLFSAADAAAAGSRIMDALSTVGLSLVREASAKGLRNESVNHFMELAVEQYPSGRVGTGVGWSAALPSGAFLFAQREIVVAVGSDLPVEERDQIRALLTPIAEREVTTDLNAINEVPLDGHASLLTDATFFDTLLADIGRSERSVLILAPFLGHRSADVAPALIEAQSRGVLVTVVLRPEHESATWADKFLSPLRRAGINVVTRDDAMHEKLVVVDEHVVMHGSLNPLSHKDTSESMMRFDSAPLGVAMSTLYHPEVGQSFAERVEIAIDDGTRREYRQAFGVQGDHPPTHWLVE